MQASHDRVTDVECACEDNYHARERGPGAIREVRTLNVKVTLAILGVLSLGTLIFEILQNASDRISNKIPQSTDTLIHAEEESMFYMLNILQDILNMTSLSNY